VALLLIAVLALFILYMTFVPSLPTEPGWTLDHWRSLASSRMVTRVLPNTAIVGIQAVLISGAFALPLAWLVTRTTLPGRTMFTTLMTGVVVVPGFVVAMGWIMLLDPQIGLLNKLLAALLRVDSVPWGVSNSVFGIGWVMGLVLVPAFFFLVAGSMRSLNPALEEAARTSGANGWQVFWRVDVPLIMPAILGAVIYIFMAAVSIFDIPGILGAGAKVPVVSSEIFYTVRPSGPSVTFPYGAAGVYALVLAVPGLIALYGYLRLLMQSSRYQVITGKGYRPRDIELGGYRWPAFAFAATYALLGAVLPLLALTWLSLMPSLQLPSLDALSKLSLANYSGLPDRLGGIAVFRNTIVLVFCTAALVAWFSMMISWIVVRTKFRARHMVDIMAMLPHAIPAIAIAFALAMFAIVGSKLIPWLPFGGTIAIIVIAHAVHWLPYGTRVTNAALAQIHRELEEAAETSGAPPMFIMRAIVVPLVKPSLVYLFMWTCLLSFQEVTMALFLSGPQNQVLSVAVWGLWEGGNFGPATAGAVLLVLLISLLTVVTFRLTGLMGGSQLGGGETSVVAIGERARN
jgi:iron(III) transport system permease protein